MDTGEMEKQIAAEAMDRGYLLLFNNWDNQVQVSGKELFENRQNLEMGLLTVLAFDQVHNKWFMYRNRTLEDVCKREITDHFASNNFRIHHQSV
ncbi:hypothetical protein [Pontibacter sp. SGAir0037]|uniref:hypothetical protein n=1 Tax=Pontibacter sp. SGAir0037 TaxID=2571030 RepID=UPI0010CCC5EE|nr:hypothetical protein [Pontibacter sp. SGAir0037]QCR23108.1 hypothetical protein C1N53_12620 [Pontibacter sp. SGAir0037]